MIGIHLSKCNQDPETCPTLAQMFEDDAYCEQMSELDPTLIEVRAMLGNLANTCTSGTCPGQNIETTREVLRSLIDKREQ